MDTSNIKQPTLRKIRNRGFEPVKYQLPGAQGFAYGWIYKRGRKLIHFRSPCTGRMRVPLEEERYMIAL